MYGTWEKISKQFDLLEFIMCEPRLWVGNKDGSGGSGDKIVKDFEYQGRGFICLFCNKIVLNVFQLIPQETIHKYFKLELYLTLRYLQTGVQRKYLRLECYEEKGRSCRENLNMWARRYLGENPKGRTN